MDEIALVCAPTGRTCGLAVISLNRTSLLSITVLPRAWRVGGPKDVAVRLVPDGNVHATVHELDVLVLCGTAPSSEQAARALLGIRVDDGDTADVGDLTKSVMFREAGSLARCYTPDDEPAMQPHAGSMWHLVGDCMEDGRPLLRAADRRAEASDIGEYLAESVLPLTDKAFREAVLRLLVDAVEESVHMFRPVFRDSVEELRYLRGRVVVGSLPRRKARRSTAVECEFADLEPDTPWMRIIRAGVREAAAGSSSQQIRDRASALDRWLTSAALDRPSVLLRQWGRARLPRHVRHLDRPLQLALALLRSNYGFGSEAAEPEDQVAAATWVTVDTSRLYERCLESGGVAAGRGWEVRAFGAGEPVRIRTHQQRQKQPDLSATGRDGRQVVLDAKYKPLDREGWSGMGMGDQYQQFAYSERTGSPCLFVFGLGAHAGLVDVDTRAGSEIPVGLARIPFPTSDSVADGTWRQVSADATDRVIDEFLAQEPSGGRPPDAHCRHGHNTGRMAADHI